MQMLGWMACHSNCRDREAGNQFPFGPGRETADDRKRPSLEMVDTFDKLLLEQDSVDIVGLDERGALSRLSGQGSCP